MKKEITINFIDFYDGFDKKDNMYTKILSKRYLIRFSDKPDFLFCSCFGSNHKNYTKCVKIFESPENILPDFNLYDYGTGFEFLEFGDRYFRKNYYYPSKEIQDRSFVKDKLFERRFCNFIYSNEQNGEGAKIRKVFCKKLMCYKAVDCPGKVLNNMTTLELAPRNGCWQNSKLDFLKKYKFTIAFENSSSNGYTTEKLYHPFQAGSIPIYWGNPLVAQDFNPKAFINCNDYNNDWDAVIQKVIELDNDKEAYLKMLSEPPLKSDFDFERKEKLEQWLFSIIEKGNKPFVKDPLKFSEKIYGVNFSYKIKFWGITWFSIKEKHNQINIRFLGIKIKKGIKNA